MYIHGTRQHPKKHGVTASLGKKKYCMTYEVFPHVKTFSCRNLDPHGCVDRREEGYGSKAGHPGDPENSG